MNINKFTRVDLDVLISACNRYSKRKLGNNAVRLYLLMSNKYEQLGCPAKGLDISLPEMCVMMGLSHNTIKSAEKARDQLIDCGLIRYKRGYKEEDAEKGKKGNVRFRHLVKDEALSSHDYREEDNRNISDFDDNYGKNEQGFYI